MAKKIYEEVTAKQTMNRVKAASMPFDWSINPYRGCAHGCSFCYARSTHTYLGMNADDSFQNHIFLKTNAAEALEAQLAKLVKKHRGDWREAARQVGLVAIGTATDPYQPVEAKAQLTRECLKVLAKYRIPTTITTRSPLILRDLDLLLDMHVTSINISVNTLDYEIYRRMEPASPFPLKRLETVQKLVEHGLPAGIFLAPVLPYLTDSDKQLEELVSAASQHRAEYLVPSVLRLAPEVKAWYFQTLRQHYPQLLPAYLKLYRMGYPDADYVKSLRRRVDQLLGKYQLSGDIKPRGDRLKQRPGEFRDAPKHRLPREVSAYPPMEAEQLSFSF
jgi:DNA repair photolyase